MEAGFARVDITPPKGTPLMGWGVAAKRLSTGVNDPIYVRAVALRDGDEEAVIVAVDLCFIGREDNDRINGILGRELGLAPRQVMINASHTHAAPAVGNYNELEWAVPARSFLRQLDAGILAAVRQAREAWQPVTLHAGRGKTTIPMNRRQLRDTGIFNAPNPGGPIYDALPVCLMKNGKGEPVCFLFAASTHAVCFSGSDVSADYPGAAMNRMDELMGRPCSLFLQGMSGDSRPRTLSEGRDWKRSPGAAETRVTGEILAGEAHGVLSHLREVEPRLATALIDTRWPLRPLSRAEYEKTASTQTGRILWAKECLRLLDAGQLSDQCSTLMQGVQLGEGLRIIAMEGEPLHPYGAMIESVYGNNGVTFAVGYTGGEGMYLVTTSMLAEGGYEPGSYWEYHQSGPLAPGMESACIEGVKKLKSMGIH